MYVCLRVRMRVRVRVEVCVCAYVCVRVCACGCCMFGCFLVRVRGCTIHVHAYVHTHAPTHTRIDTLSNARNIYVSKDGCLCILMCMNMK